MLSKCEHAFCRTELASWTNQNRNRPECPECRQRYSPAEISEPTRIIRNMLDMLTLKCDQPGCTTEYKYDAKSKHNCNQTQTAQSTGNTTKKSSKNTPRNVQPLPVAQPGLVTVRHVAPIVPTGPTQAIGLARPRAPLGGSSGLNGRRAPVRYATTSPVNINNIRTVGNRGVYRRRFYRTYSHLYHIFGHII